MAFFVRLSRSVCGNIGHGSEFASCVLQNFMLKYKVKERKSSAAADAPLHRAEEAGYMMRKKKKEDVRQQPCPPVEKAYPDPEYGLTASQVRLRAEAGLTNFTEDGSSMTTSDIIRSNVLTYFNLIFFVIAAVLLLVGSYNNMTFLLVVFFNTVIGIAQELRSKRTLDRLTILAEPEVDVIRDGQQTRIHSSELVRDDIAIFRAGNQICADAVVRKGQIVVNEALVTGEADEIAKQPGDTLLSGSFVISGEARAQAERVGSDAFAAKLTKDAKKIKKQQQPGMIRSLTRLIQIVGIVIIPIAVLMFWNQYHVLGTTVKVGVENTAASIIGMIPEGLYLLTSVALATSTVRLAKRKTLVHDMKCIETLARVDTLCVDKTGTITQPEMQVEAVLPLADEEEDRIRRLLGTFVGHMASDNETMAALKAYLKDFDTGAEPVRILAFTSRNKFSAADFGALGMYVLGAPDILFRRPTPEMQSLIAERAAQGDRLLLLAGYDFDIPEEDIFAGGRLLGRVRPLALVALSNAIRPHAKETFGYFTDQGVTIKVISGDSAQTASLAALKAGIPGAENYIDLTELGSTAEVAQAAQNYTVFGRVTPEQKRILIRALKKKGHTVAMTGDGVNDVLALKDADCSIAMASGSDAAANVSDLVLLNSDFSGMPQVVAEGRRVINNIERSASLYLMKNIFSMILSLVSLISVSLYPLKPVQISLVSGLMIGTPSFFLALEPNHDLVRGKFLRNVLYRAFPAALTAVVLVEWCQLFSKTFSISPDMASTMCLYLFAFASYIMLYRVCRPMNTWHAILFGAMGLGFVGACIWLDWWFQISALDLRGVLVLSPLLLLAVPIDHVFHLLFDAGARVKERICRKYTGKKK